MTQSVPFSSFSLPQVGFWNSSETDAQKRLHMNLTIEKAAPEHITPIKEPLRGEHIRVVMVQVSCSTTLF